MLNLLEFHEVKALRTQKLTLTTITPLLMHGWQKQVPDQNKRLINKPVSAEVRPPSIKGMLRFWWRALQFDVKDPNELSKKETNLFGGAGSKENSRRSPLIIQTEQVYQTSHDKHRVLPHSTKKGFESLGISPNTDFTLLLSVLKRDEDKLTFFEELLKWSVLVGGFGLRQNRGFGSLDLKDLAFTEKEAYLNQVKDLFVSLVSRSASSIEINLHSSCLFIRNVDSRWPLFQSLTLGKAYDKPQSALFAINQASHKVAGKFNGALGDALSERKPSPLKASVKKIGNDYYPIIVTVSYPPLDYPQFKPAAKYFIEEVGGIPCDIFS